MNAIVMEDQILIREFIASFLRKDFKLDVIGEYEDGERGLQACIDFEPELVVLDLKLQRLGGLAVFNRLKDLLPDTKVILVSAHFTPEIVKKAVARGVNGLVSKNSALESFKDAICQILKGAVYFSPEAFSLLRQPEGKRAYAQGVNRLTPREIDILQMVGEGYSSKEIAQSFSLSVRTIDAHRSNITRKMHLRGATDMARLAIKMELVSQA